MLQQRSHCWTPSKQLRSLALAPMLQSASTDFHRAAQLLLQQLNARNSTRQKLNIVATAAGGAPSDLLSVLNHIDGTTLTAAIALAANSILDKDPALKEEVLKEVNLWGLLTVHESNNYCAGGIMLRNAFQTTDLYTKSHERLGEIISRYAPIQREMARQKLGKFAPNAPVLLYGAVNDDLIPIDQIRNLRDDWRALGFNALSYIEDTTPTILDKTGANHIAALFGNLPRATEFIWSHFPDRPDQQNLAL